MREILSRDHGEVWGIDFLLPTEKRLAVNEIDDDRTYERTHIDLDVGHTAVKLEHLDPILLVRTPEIKEADGILVNLIEYSRRIGYDYQILIDFFRKLRLRSWEDYISRLGSELKEAFEAVCTDDADKERFVGELLAAAELDAAPTFQLPTAAPALWLERENRKETAPDFIKRVYAPWLGQGLTQAHILHLDKPLYTALHKWLRSNDMPADLDLPTKKQMNDRLLEAGRPSGSEWLKRAVQDADPALKERIRLYNVARRRAHRAVAKPR